MGEERYRKDESKGACGGRRKAESDVLGAGEREDGQEG